MARRSDPADPIEPESPSGAPASSTDSSGASEPFFAHDGRGPSFEPDEVDDAPQPASPYAEIEPSDGWDEDVVANLLSAKGMALHTVIGKAEADWVYTPLELRATAPPLTRILNRIPATAAAAGSGDELALIIALTAYVGRSISERQAAVKAEREAAGDELGSLGAPVFSSQPPPLGEPQPGATP